MRMRPEKTGYMELLYRFAAIGIFILMAFPFSNAYTPGEYSENQTIINITNSTGENTINFSSGGTIAINITTDVDLNGQGTALNEFTVNDYLGNTVSTCSSPCFTQSGSGPYYTYTNSSYVLPVAEDWYYLTIRIKDNGPGIFEGRAEIVVGNPASQHYIRYFKNSSYSSETYYYRPGSYAYIEMNGSAGTADFSKSNISMFDFQNNSVGAVPDSVSTVSSSQHRINVTIPYSITNDWWYPFDLSFLDSGSAVLAKALGAIIGIDANPPNMTVELPQNTTYLQMPVWFNITAADAMSGTEWCGYSLNNSANITMDLENATHYSKQNDSMADGVYDVVFYCNDSVGNYNSSAKIYFTVNVSEPLGYLVWGITAQDGADIGRGQPLEAYAQWNYTLASAYLEHNGSGAPVNYTISPPYTDNWTNYTLDLTNGSQFSPGLVNITAIYATSTEGTSNSTMPSRYFYLWGYSNISWQSPAPESEYPRGITLPLTCNVLDNYTGEAISNYNVSFYITNATETWLLGNASTEESGNATYNWYVNESIYSNGTYYPLCNITSNSVAYYNISGVFETNTTVNITTTVISGDFEVSLIVPPEGSTTQVAQYRNLTVNATAKCINGACGSVNGTLQYSDGGAPATIPAGSGTPFFVISPGQNPQGCGTMLQNDICNLSWVINATGAIDTIWNISALFEGVQATSNRTENSTVEIKYLLILTVTPSAISTWYDPPSNPDENYDSASATNWLEPGTSGAEASSVLTVFLSANSSDANGGIWIKGENLTSVQPSTYLIPAYNVSLCPGNLGDYPTPNSASACLSDTTKELSEEYKQVSSSLNSGQSQEFVLFLDMPYGLSSYVGGYTGEVWVKVNATTT